MTAHTQKDNSALKNIDFVAWRIAKARTEQKQDEVNRKLFERPRQRRITRH